MSTKRFADATASKSTTDCGLRPMRLGSASRAAFLRFRSDLAAALTSPRPDHGGALLVGVGIGPVVEFLASAAWRQPADVRALAVRALELLLGDITVLVPLVVLLGDPEVDERAVPDVSKGHFQRDSNRGRARSRFGSTWPPLPPRSGSPGSFPSTIR